MPAGWRWRGSSWKRMSRKSPVSSIWVVACAYRDSSRSSGGRLAWPGMKRTAERRSRARYGKKRDRAVTGSLLEYALRQARAALQPDDAERVEETDRRATEISVFRCP